MVRASRIGAGSSSRRVTTSRVTSVSESTIADALRSACSSDADSGSSSRARTNESGSSASIGHSSSIDASNRAASTCGTSGPSSRPQAMRCRTGPAAPNRACKSAGASAATSPSVLSPHRPNVDRCSESPNTARTSTGSVRTAARSSPRGTTITGHAPASARLRPGSPERPVASLRSRRQPAPSSLAAVPVAAIATAASTPRARASRASSRPTAGGSPTIRPRPEISRSTASPRRSTRGEKSRARSSNSAGGQLLLMRQASMTARAAAVGGRRTSGPVGSFPPRTDRIRARPSPRPDCARDVPPR